MSAPLPQGAVHLLMADNALAEGHRYGAYIAACGEVVCASSLPAALCPRTATATIPTARRAFARLSAGTPKWWSTAHRGPSRK
jgi:hypothetical protein